MPRATSDESEGAGPPSAWVRDFDAEEPLAGAAGEAARRWAGAQVAPLVVAFRGGLGSGKTTWIRAMLRGLGYRERVPSPTYTLVEHYALPGLTVVHLDLYRLSDDAALENLGLRDWLGQPGTWLLVEWPERSAALLALADVEIGLDITGPVSRRVRAAGRTPRGRAAVGLLAELLSK